MKWCVSACAILLLIWFVFTSSAPVKVAPTPRINNARASVRSSDEEKTNVRPEVISKIPVAKIEVLSREIQDLKLQLNDVDAELRGLGFPKIFLDERLTEREREELLWRIEVATQLQDKITRLSINKIDLETGGDL